MAIVTLQQAKDHLRITTTDSDADLTLKLGQAEAYVIGWCSTTPRAKAIADTWIDAASTPLVVVAAILNQVGELDRFRGDDPAEPPRESGTALAVTVRELLVAYHDGGIG